MNHDENNPDMKNQITAEMEARMVAWVAGTVAAATVPTTSASGNANAIRRSADRGQRPTINHS